MLGRYINPQLVDDLAVGLCARFNIKSDPKDVVKYINNFGYVPEKGKELIMSGFPIGKIESEEQFIEIQKVAIEKDQYFNVQTGRWMNSNNNKMVYGDGWCAKRNSPEHQAMLKIVSEEIDSDELSIEVDEKDNWLIIKDTNYIFSKEKEKIVGRLNGGKAMTLTHKAIKCIKKAGYPYERIEEEELKKCRFND
jgi:hypothetical protein